MRRISISGESTDPKDILVYDEDAQQQMPEVQAFSLACSIDDAGLFGKIIWLDFRGYDAGCIDQKAIEDASNGILPEIEEDVQIIKIDIKSKS